MTLLVSISTLNAAFGEDADERDEIARRIIRLALTSPLAPGATITLRDDNGNSVGTIERGKE